MVRRCRTGSDESVSVKWNWFSLAGAVVPDDDWAKRKFQYSIALSGNGTMKKMISAVEV